MEGCSPIEIITGCMYSGKTSRLIETLKRLEFAGVKVQSFKHSSDTRYSEKDLASHSEIQLPSTPVKSADDLASKIIIGTTEVVGIDEVHFFDSNIITTALLLAEKGVRVIAAGLDLDFRGEYFRFSDGGADMSYLLKLGKITYLTAVCTDESRGKKCGLQATRTQRIMSDGSPAPYDDDLKKVGSKGVYEARCLLDHIVLGKPKFHPFR